MTLAELFRKIGQGYVLGINEQRKEAILVLREMFPQSERNKERVSVDYAAAVQWTGQMRKLTPERNRDILGYREMGLDESHDWYCLIQ